tara:strand:+ start:389 stop:1240 length:852 start_codon:yes stop_codon:yes gene_type:complete
MFDEPVMIRLVLTLVLVAGILAMRWGLTRWVRRDSALLSDAQRQRLFYVRTASHVFFVVGIGLIWLTQIQNAALSLTAVIVAVVIATKELLICLAGFLVRTGSRSFSVGDWIEVNGVRGEVVDFTPLTTTLLELDEREFGRDYTGRTTIIPNAWYVTHQVINETFGKNYAVHRFRVTVEPGLDIAAAREFLLTQAAELCSRYHDVASRYNALIERKLAVDLPGPDPEVTITTTDLGKLQFHILLFCPTHVVENLQATITERFLDAVAREGIPRIVLAEKPELS